MSETSPQTATVVLDPDLGTAALPPLLDTLRQARGRDLIIDASGVEFLGAQCAELLVSAWRTWAGDDAALVFCEPSEAFCELAALMGLDRELQLQGRI